PVTPEPTIEPTEVPEEPEVPDNRVDHNVVIDTVINFVAGLVLAAFGTAPVTVAIVSVLKKISLFDNVSGPALTFGTASVLYVLALIASAMGKVVEFEGILELLAVIGPAIASFITTLI